MQDRGRGGHSLNRSDTLRVKGAVKHVETLSRESVNVTPAELRPRVMPTAETVTWPIKITGEPPSGSTLLSICYLGTAYIPQGGVWTEVEVLVRPINDDVEMLSVGMMTMGILLDTYRDESPYKNFLIFTAAHGKGTPSTRSPSCCLEWYTAYHHLGTVAVTVGQRLLAGAAIGTVGIPDSGSHSHFSLGDGADILNLTNQSAVGQTLDIDDWLPWPKEGQRAIGLPSASYQPPLFKGVNDQDAARRYIRSVFAPWVPVEGYKQVYGSLEHFGGEYYAVDIFPGSVDPTALPASTVMDGVPVTLAIGSDLVQSTVIFAGEIDPTVKSMVIVRHTPFCCPDSWKQPVRVASVINADIDTAFVVGEVIDGVELALGDPILLLGQTDPTERYIGTVNTMGRPTLRNGADSGSDYVGAVVYVSEGTRNGNSIWACKTPAPIDITVEDLTWQIVWRSGFFAKLTTQDPGAGDGWKWRRQTVSATGVWGDGGAESEFYDAFPITYNGVDYFSEPTDDMNVWMHWGDNALEFFPLAPSGSTETLGCGLSRSGGNLHVDLTDKVSSGLNWDAENCRLGINLGCGLYYDGENVAVNVDQVAGDRASTALVPVDSADPDCDSVAVDLEEVIEYRTTETLVTNSLLSIVAGKLRQTITKVTYTNHFNEAGLLIDRTAGEPVETYTDLNVCAAVACCSAEELSCACGKSGSGGTAPYEADFTATPSGGVAPYTYEWTFGDGEFSAEQNPTHEYAGAGTYNPYVDVTDACGHTVTCTVGGSIVVTGEEVPGTSCAVPLELAVGSLFAWSTPESVIVGDWYKVFCPTPFTTYRVVFSDAADPIIAVVLTDACTTEVSIMSGVGCVEFDTDAAGQWYQIGVFSLDGFSHAYTIGIEVGGC